MKTERFQFWYAYWASLNCLFTGCLIGLGFSGKSIVIFTPILIVIWLGFGLFVIITYLKRGSV